jgi:hypothetical protein
MNLGTASVMHAKVRLLLPAFTMLIPVAIALAKRRTGTVVLVLAAAGLAGAWFGAHSLTVWKYAM